MIALYTIGCVRTILDANSNNISLIRSSGSHAGSARTVAV
jgi:hypothetical protein